MAKHMKQGRPGGPERAASEKAPRERFREPRRDRAFREELAREYGVEEPPRHFQRMMAKTLESLPDEMPVRPRPVFTVVRSAATVLALVAVVFVSLLGLNTTYPQLTEALPGLGQVFAAMNGGRAEKLPVDDAEPTPTHQPEFQLVTVLSKGDFPGVLTVEDAWSDGKTLVLDLSIAPYAELKEMMGYEAADDSYFILDPGYLEQVDGGYGEYENTIAYTSSITITTGGNASPVKGVFPNFRPEGENLISRWRTELPEPAEDGSLTVDLSIPDLVSTSQTAYGDESQTSWSAGFYTSFTVPVSSGRNRQFQLDAVDNQIHFNYIDYTPSRVDIQATVPYLGMAEDFPMNLGGSEMPLCTAAELTCGDYVYQLINVNSGQEKELLMGESPEELDLRYSFISSGEDGVHPKDLSGPLVLTFYELPEEAEQFALRRVAAEFTIDLHTGKAYPSENYQAAGREKADTSQTPAQRLEKMETEGILVTGGVVQGTYDYPMASFTLAERVSVDGAPSRQIAALAYVGENLAQEFYFPLGEESTDGVNECTVSYSNASIAGMEYRLTEVRLQVPEWVYAYAEDRLPAFDRIAIIDPDTGLPLIEDVDEAYQNAISELMGSLLPPESGATTESQPDE